jgi:membrane-bound lytic murein transglycosylase D
MIRSMAATLRCQSGSLKGRELKLKSEVTRLGRKRENDLVFTDGIVSSYHAEIRREADRYLLVDCEATNGTLVNGKQVRRAQLRDRDRIELGEGGPLLEFRSDAEIEDRRPRLEPLSGVWERGMKPLRLETGSITLGRSPRSDVVVGRVSNSVVSSRHAVIIVGQGKCEIEDAESANGVLINGRRVLEKAQLRDGDRVELGEGGPAFTFSWPAQSGVQQGTDSGEIDRMLERLDNADSGARLGDRTRVMLQVVDQYYKRKRRPLVIVSAVVIIAALALYAREVAENRRLRKSAEEVFYSTRAIAAQLVRQRDSMTQAEIQTLTRERLQQQQAYDQFLTTLGLYEGKTPVQRAVMRLARQLGDADLDVPPDFFQATQTYIDRWRSTQRLGSALERARQQSLPHVILTALDQYGLPREFFFIPLQESAYDPQQVGPETAHGIPKGLWQLIPSTALDYHLRLGPLKDARAYDPSDQRHDQFASTAAAVRYLAYLYSTKAAASGLLVIASYNYGQSRIIQRLDQLPNDPRQRNFWNFYRNGWVPEETRNYVMSIFSAALICEKPDLFNIHLEACPAW